MKQCVIVEIQPTEITKSKIKILPSLLELSPEDYFYLFYDSIFKVGIVGVSRENVKNKLDVLKKSGDIVNYRFLEDEVELDISKIIACSSRKISDYIETKIQPLTVEGLITEIVKLPEINAQSYEPLHFILNQLRLHNKESEIRFRLFTDSRYIEGYRQFGNQVYR